MSDNKIIRAWDRASKEERMRFLCDMNKRYRATGDEHGGLIVLHHSLMRKIAEVKKADDIDLSESG